MARTITDKQQAAQEIADALAGRDPASTDWRDAAPLREIAEAFRESVAAESALAQAVAAARTAGCSWAQVGAVLGISKQSAQGRYGPKHADDNDKR